MSKNVAKDLWMGAKGEVIPSTPTQRSRGMLALVDPSSGDDRAYMCLQRSAGTIEYVELAFVEDITAQATAEALLYKTLEQDGPLNEIYMLTYALAGGTTFQVGGMGAPTVAGTPSNADTSFGPQVRLTSGAVSGNVSSLVMGSGATILTPWNPRWTFQMATGSDVTNIRYHFGAYASTPSGSSNPAINGFGFRFDTAIDSFWKAWSSDGATPLATNTLVTPASGTVVEFAIVVRGNGTAIDFYINGSLLATHTTNLPSTSTNLTYGAYCTTLTAATKSFRAIRMNLAYGR